MEDKVSIVVPVYNVYPFLRQCVDSIIKQTYKNIEVILVDDGSPDECGKLCDEYEKKYTFIKCIHKDNAGLGMARNTGINNATGNYITFVDGDDFVEKDHIYRLLKQLKVETSDVCYGGFRQQKGNDYIVQVNPMAGKTLHKEKIMQEFLPRMCGKLKYGTVDEVSMSVCMNLYSLSIIKAHNILFQSERKIISEDFIFNMDFLEYVNKITVTNSCGYYYRDNANSLTKKYLGDRLQKQIYFTKYIIERSEKMGFFCYSDQRIYSTFLSWVRNIVKSEQQNYKNVGVLASIKNIKRICQDEYVKEILSHYDDNNLTFMPKLLNKLIRKNACLTIWLFSYLKSCKKN